ncbi:MAG: DNA gyrase inhibitor YacG [Pseudomonadota bacterium]
MSKAKCPVCERRSVEPEYRPFCSRRCADVDLSRWLKGGYAIPGRPAEDADDVPSYPDPDKT